MNGYALVGDNSIQTVTYDAPRRPAKGGVPLCTGRNGELR